MLGRLCAWHSWGGRGNGACSAPRGGAGREVGLTAVFSYRMGEGRRDGARLLLEQSRGNGCKLQQRRLQLCIMKRLVFSLPHE